MQANSDQQLSAIFEIHNSNLTSSFTWQILALVRTLPLNAILKIIYLIHELPSTKHLVSMDTFTISLLQPSLKHFQNLLNSNTSKVSHICVLKAHLLHAIIIMLTLQGIVISFMQLNEGLDTLTSQVYHPYHPALPQRISGSQLIMTILHS